MTAGAIIGAILGAITALFNLIRNWRGKSKKDAVLEANERVSEAREAQAHSDNEVAILKAQVKKEEEGKKTLEEIKNETEY